MRRFIIFLVRKKLGLKKYEDFRFRNQKSEAFYFFTDRELIKEENGYRCSAGVSLNWLLSDECEICKIYWRNKQWQK